MVFFTSDLHLGHENIIKYCERPFANASEMDKRIRENWNSAVGDKDTVYILGDLTKIEDAATINAYLDGLRGEKILILGNHDEFIRENKDAVSFCEVLDYKEITVDGRQVVLCHYPILEWNRKQRGAICLHGHTHYKDRRGAGVVGLFDVGVDANGFTPKTLEQILKECDE